MKNVLRQSRNNSLFIEIHCMYLQLAQSSWLRFFYFKEESSMKGSVISKGKNRWELRISAGYKDGKQIRHTKTIQAKSKKAAEQALPAFYAEVMNTPKAPSTPNSSDITFRKFAAIWEQRHNQYLALNTRTMQTRLLRNRIMKFFGRKALSQIDGQTILDFIAMLKKSRKKTARALLSATGVHKHFTLVKLMLNKAVEWNYLEKNPCYDIPFKAWPKPKYKRHSIWQENDLQVFLNYLDSLPDTPVNIKHKAMFYLYLLSGARRGEICALTWPDIDYEKCGIWITKSETYISREVYEISEPKTEASTRFLYVDEYIMSLLKKHRKFQLQYLAKKQYSNPDKYVFLAVRRKHGKLVPICPNAIYQWLQTTIQKIGLPRIGIHSLRNMAATYSLNNGAALTTVQSMLGHTNIRTTSLYLHPLESKKRENANILSKQLHALRNHAAKDKK